jgi:hypothetical protein
MKRAVLGSMLLLLLLIPTLVIAGYGKAHQVVTGSLGGVLGADASDAVQGTGASAGLAYRTYTSDIFSLGLDVSYDHYKDRSSDSDQVDYTLVTPSLLGRLDFWPNNEWASYVSLGMGPRFIHKEFHKDSHTESSSKLGGFLALGIEGPLSPNWMWGGELRSTDPLGQGSDSLALRVQISRSFK